MARFFEKTKSGFYDVHITLYDKDNYPFYQLDKTLKGTPVTIKESIETAIDCYKTDSCYDKRKDTDELKFEPSFVAIFTSPAFKFGVFSLNGRRIKNIDIKTLKRCNVYWQ